MVVVQAFVVEIVSDDRRSHGVAVDAVFIVVWWMMNELNDMGAEL